MKKIKLLSLVLFFISFNLKAKSYEFDNLVVFGDSISDVGNRANQGILKAVAGKNNLNYTDYLIPFFTGKKSIPGFLDANGGNYAFDGAIAENTKDSRFMTIDKEFNAFVFNLYKNSHNNIINIPNNLYIVWAGGNDLSFSFLGILRREVLINISKIIGKEALDEKSSNDIRFINNIKATKDISNFINQNLISDVNAKYIMVPNIYNVSLSAPLNYVIPTILCSTPINFISNIPAMLFFRIVPYMENMLINKNYSLFGFDFHLLPFSYDKRKKINIKFQEGINNLAESYGQIHEILVSNNVDIITKYYLFLLDNHLRSKNNIPYSNGIGVGAHYITNNIYNYYNNIPIIGNLFKDIFLLINNYVLDFNKRLESELKVFNGNIIFVDIAHLFYEIIDNPTYYGVNDILLSQCSLGFSVNLSSECHEGGSKNHENKNYLWSDIVHPSKYLHKLFADYMISIFTAPLLVSSIPRQLDSFTRTSEDYINNELINIKNIDLVNKFMPLVSIGGVRDTINEFYNYDNNKINNNILNLGLIYGVNDKLLIGSILNFSYGKMKPYDNFRYKYFYQMLNLFAKYQITQKWWLSTIINYGFLNANKIKRNIVIGSANYQESGKTSANVMGINAISGYDLISNESRVITLILKLAYHKYLIHGYQEKDDRSTSMTYGKIKYDDLDLGFAFRLAKNINNTNTYLELGISQNFTNHFDIKTSIKGKDVFFNKEINNNNDLKFDLGLGVNSKISKNFNINANLNYKINSRLKRLNYAIGVSRIF